MTPLSKVIKAAANDDKVTLRAEEGSDILTVLLEAKCT